MAASKAKHILQDALHFTIEDIECNREGWMSDSQRQRISSERKKWMLVSIVTATVYGIILVSIIRRNPAAIISSNDVGSLALMSVFAAPIFFGSLIKWVKFLRDEIGKRVTMAAGLVELDIVERRRGNTVYKLEVEDAKFDVDKTAFLAFKNRDQYCVYYAPHSRNIVAAEYIRE